MSRARFGHLSGASLVTWRNAQPTGTVAQLLHATEAAGAQRLITHVKAHSESE